MKVLSKEKLTILKLKLQLKLIKQTTIIGKPRPCYSRLKQRMLHFKILMKRRKTRMIMSPIPKSLEIKLNKKIFRRFKILIRQGLMTKKEITQKSNNILLIIYIHFLLVKGKKFQVMNKLHYLKLPIQIQLKKWWQIK